MLAASSVSVRYGSRIAVADVSLRLEPGQLTAVIGPNGAGKSTLLRSMSGAVALSKGEVRLDERPLSAYARRGIARRVAVVSQEADLRFPFTVMEFVLGGRYAASSGAWGWESERDIAVAREVLCETELNDFAGRLMNELSGGERQRAVVARALATEAKVFLLDEPTANLDLAHQATMLRLIRARCDTQQAAAMVVTHDINLAAEFSDRMLLLKEGRVAGHGSVGEVLSESLLREVFGLELMVDPNPITNKPRVTPVYGNVSVRQNSH
jgi:iron complex transport system ATP-binding protein